MPEVAAVAKVDWPAGLVERVQAVRAVLEAAAAPLTAEALARSFKSARTDAVAEIATRWRRSARPGGWRTGGTRCDELRGGRESLGA